MKTFEGDVIAVPQLGHVAKPLTVRMEGVVLNLCYSRIDSSSETADQRITLAKEDIFGS